MTQTSKRADEIQTGDVLLNHRVVESVFTPLGSQHDALFMTYRLYPTGRLFTGFLAWRPENIIGVRVKR
jgi:hypothetical protein